MNHSAAGPRVVERLYYDSPDLVFRAQVTDIQLVAQERGENGQKGQVWRVALDRTAFYPESGGQPWDTGVLVATARSGAVLEVPVERVEEDDSGEVWHFVRKPLVQGTEIEGRVDSDRRADHMQQHSGQHLLSAVFLERLGARTVSFHLGSEASTIDLSPPDGKDALTSLELAEVETATNRAIFEDRALRPQWYTREQAEAMLARGELRKLPERTGPMRVVEMEGIEWNACGGTHVRSTGAIGGLLLRRVEKVKAGWRVEFLCGQRAVRAARRDFELLTGLANTFSVGAIDLPGRLSLLQEENKASAKLQRTLQDELADAKAGELLSGSVKGGLCRSVFTGKPVDFVKRVASVVGAAGRSAVIGAVEGNKAAVALALPPDDPHHAGNLLREVASRQGARGGGGPQLAQGVCEPAQLDSLLQALADALR